MEIPSPTTLSPMNKYCSQQSIEDIYFLPKSHYLVSDQEVPPVILNYRTAFNEIKCGILGKKTMNSNWQERFFVLTPVRLLYFYGSDRKQLKGCFNFASLLEYDLRLEANFPEIGQKYTKHRFVARAKKDEGEEDKIVLVLQILNHTLYNQWLSAFKAVIESLKQGQFELKMFPRLGAQKLLQNNHKLLNSNFNYWNKITISKTELLRYASHLDIIFLRNKSIFSSLHRFFMRSHYDHVGLLLKDEAEKPYILEVVNEKGVVISPLENLLHSASEEYEEIGYRKLLPESSHLNLESLQNYINSLIGKKYELSITKLLIGNQSELSDEASNSEQFSDDQKPEKTYFCSELIADIYLKFGILVQGKSNNFWPKDFQENTLPLSPGYCLSPLMQVQIVCEENQGSACQQ